MPSNRLAPLFAVSALQDPPLLSKLFREMIMFIIVELVVYYKVLFPMNHIISSDI